MPASGASGTRRVCRIIAALLARRAAAVLAILVVVTWAIVPLARGLLLVRRLEPSAPLAIAMPHEDVAFSASDGVALAGTYLPADGARGTVVLVHGFKNSRVYMLEH